MPHNQFNQQPGWNPHTGNSQYNRPYFIGPQINQPPAPPAPVQRTAPQGQGSQIDPLQSVLQHFSGGNPLHPALNLPPNFMQRIRGATPTFNEISRLQGVMNPGMMGQRPQQPNYFQQTRSFTPQTYGGGNLSFDEISRLSGGNPLRLY